MTLQTELYTSLAPAWPKSGRHILASFDHETIVVYQAYRPEIADFAVRHGRFGGEFSFSRMSWIKPNFLWMMFRSGWGTKPDQERTLALRIRRSFFDGLLAGAVPSTWDPRGESSQEDWQKAVARSDVRLQWDPDHHPTGAPVDRRAIQLGLRHETLRKFGHEELLEVIDLSDFVAEQRRFANSPGCSGLRVPVEAVYQPADPVIARRLGLDGTPPWRPRAHE